MNTIFKYFHENINDKKVVIYGCFKNARNFAMRLLNQNIHFDYFLCPHKGNYLYPYVLNKPVIGFEGCKQMKGIVIVAPRQGREKAKKVLDEEGLGDCFVELEEVQDIIRRAPALVIWGTGGRAKSFYSEYKNLLNVYCFCDSNPQETDGYFEEKPVIHSSQLKSLPKDTVVIIASVFYDEILKKSVELGIDENNILILQHSLEDYVKAVGHKFFDNMILFGNIISNCILLGKKDYFSHEEMIISEIVFNFKNKELVLYGEREIAEDLSCKMGLLDMTISKVVGREMINADGSIYNILYYLKSDEVLLLVDEFSESVDTFLKEMGINYIWLDLYNGYQHFQDSQVTKLLDPNLGHSFHKENEEYKGFIKFEYIKRNSRPIRIVSLGGSTTSAYKVYEKSWSECLSEKLKEHEISHVIYCGGIQAYTVSQEFIKLVRDAIILEPDIVISYSGVNDMGISNVRNVAPGLPFISLYQTTLFDVVGKLRPNGDEVEGINWGIERREKDFFDVWYTTERMMSAVCKELNIAFKAFLQPALVSAKGCCQQSADIAAWYGYLWDEEKGEYCSMDFDSAFSASLHWIGVDSHLYYSSILEWANRFRKCGQTIQDSWFRDFSDLFDDDSGVYIDDFHVSERGNMIIAEKILEEIREEVDRFSD